MHVTKMFDVQCMQKDRLPEACVVSCCISVLYACCTDLISPFRLGWQYVFLFEFSVIRWEAKSTQAQDIEVMEVQQARVSHLLSYCT